MNWKNERWLSLDLEATDKDPAVAQIVQVGLTWWHRGEQAEGLPGWTEHLVRPEDPIPAEATAIHGITDAMVANAPSIEDLALDIKQAVASAPVVIGYHAWDYDFPLLNRAIPGFRDLFRECITIDVLHLVRTEGVGRYWKNEEGRPGRHTLGEACRRTGIDVDAERTHGAEYDTILTAQLLGWWRNALTDNGLAAQRWLLAERAAETARFEKWKADNPLPESD